MCSGSLYLIQIAYKHGIAISYNYIFGQNGVSKYYKC